LTEFSWVCLIGGRIQKEYAAGEQDQLFAAEPQIANREQLFFQADHPADNQQQQQSHAARSQKTDASRFALLIQGRAEVCFRMNE